MSLRILYLHQHYSGPAGSTATRSHAMAAALAARGHAVTLACGRYAGAETGLAGPFRHGLRRGRLAGFELAEFDIPCGNAMGLAARSRAFLRFAARTAPLAASGRFDLVIASSTPLTVALPALAAHALRGTPFLFEIRDPWPELPRALGGVPRPALAAMDRLADAACRRAAAVVASSPAAWRRRRSPAALRRAASMSCPMAATCTPSARISRPGGRRRRHRGNASPSMPGPMAAPTGCICCSTPRRGCAGTGCACCWSAKAARSPL